jgi:hypothetical protein
LKKGMKIEKHRPFIKVEELNEFYGLCKDDLSCSIVASLLSAYGFATENKSQKDEEKLIELADKLGYTLTKIDQIVDDPEEVEQNEDNQEELN